MKRKYNVVSAQEYYEGEIRNKRIGEWKALPDLPYMKNTPTQTTGYCVNIYEEEKQEIFGFGAAITEGAAFQYFNMDDINKVKALELLFGKSGLNYNLCRLCIGSSDFTIDEYSYVRDGDENLHTFTIERDKKYIVPFLKDIVKKREGEITFIASPWSPPAFMKNNRKLINGGALRREYYRTFAEYEAKFIEEYQKEGIKISALTVQNEPDACQTWESCRYETVEEAEYALVLADVLKEHDLDTKLLIWDHNKGNTYNRVNEIYPMVGDKVWGAAFHWYDGSHFDECQLIKDKYPDKVLIETEFCSGFSSYYSDYRTEIIGNLQHGVNGIIEWCLMADENGAPFHNRDFGCVTTIYYDTRTKEIKKRGIYGKMYLFSNKIQKGAKVLYTSTFDPKINILAVKNPNEHIITIINNEHDSLQYVNLRIEDRINTLQLFPKSSVVIELSENICPKSGAGEAERTE